jgi:hypothetical protein
VSREQSPWGRRSSIRHARGKKQDPMLSHRVKSSRFDSSGNHSLMYAKSLYSQVITARVMPRGGQGLFANRSIACRENARWRAFTGIASAHGT